MLARIASILVLTALVGASVRAQSLGDLARQEAERRKETSDSTRVITNKDLPGRSAGAASAAAPASTPTDATASKDTKADAKIDAKSDAKAAGAATAQGKADETVKDEKYWAGRQKDLSEQLSRDQIYLDALQSRINALTTDFINRDDPAQRSVIATDRQRSLDEMDRLKTAIADDKKAIADFQEEARRAGVPPGWLR